MITLGIDGKGAQKGMRQITSVVSEGLSSVTSLFTGFSAGLAGIFSVGAAFSTWKEQAAEFGAVSRNLNMSMEDVQGWVGAMQKFGGSSADFESTLRGLNGQLAKMATLGTSRTGKLLESIGIDAGAVGRQRDALDVLEDIAGVMEGMTADESRGLGAALGLDSSTIMLLQQGREGMKDLIREKKESAVYTKEDADAVKAYGVAMGALKKSFMGIMGVLFRMIMPAMTAVTKVIGDFVAGIRKHQTFLKVFFTMIAALVAGLLLPTILSFFAALLTNPMTWVILTLAALALAVEDLIVWMQGGESEFADFWAALFGSPEEAQKTFDDLVTAFWTFTDVVVDSAKAIGTVLMPVLDDLGRLFAWLWENALKPLIPVLKVIWKLLAFAFLAPIAAVNLLIATLLELLNLATGGETLFQELWKALFGDPDYFKHIVEDITSFFRRLWEQAVKWVEQKWQDLKDTAAGVLDAIKAAVSDFASFIIASIGGAIDWALAKWQAFKAAIMGEAASIDLSPSVNQAANALGARMGTTTNNQTSTINIGQMTLNGIKNGGQAASDFSAGLSSHNLVAQGNAGVW
jgi:hypothetical protein